MLLVFPYINILRQSHETNILGVRPYLADATADNTNI